MNLIQQDNIQPAQNLPLGDPTVYTGPMGNCVCVIVMWNPDPQGRYQNVRGFHGSGGIGGVNFGSLFQGVPNLGSTSILVISGHGNMDIYSIQSERNTIRTQADNHFLTHAYIHVTHGVGSATIDRFGQITRH